MARLPKPLYFTSTRCPQCGPVRWGQAVPPRERALIVQMRCAGHSYVAISRMPFIGRRPATVAAIVRRAVHSGSLLPRPTGGRDSCPPKLGLAAVLAAVPRCCTWLLYLKALQQRLQQHPER